MKVLFHGLALNLKEKVEYCVQNERSRAGKPNQQFQSGHLKKFENGNLMA